MTERNIADNPGFNFEKSSRASVGRLTLDMFDNIEMDGGYLFTVEIPDNRWSEKNFVLLVADALEVLAKATRRGLVIPFEEHWDFGRDDDGKTVYK